MRYVLGLQLFLLIHFVNSSHFRGGTISWKPIHGQTIGFTFKMGWTLGSGPGCNQAKIGQFVNGTFIGDKLWKCVDGCTPDSGSNSVNVGTIYYYCTAADTVDDWEQGENSFQYNFTGSGPFTVSYTGAMWMPLDFGSPNGWVLMTTIDLRFRDDINSTNSSPITASKPLYTLQFDCYQELQLPMYDPDGDLVKCRWSRDKECDSVCQAVPDATLDEDTCTVKFNASKGTKYNDDGWYAVALTFEDFPKKTIHVGNQVYNETMALSTVPLQFLIHLVRKSTPCNWKPEFVSPTPLEGTKISIPANKQFDLKLYAANVLNINEKVTKLSLTMPAGLVFKGPTDDPNRKGVVYWELSWTPTEKDRGNHIVCGMAEDASGHISDTRCITLLAWDLPDPCASKPCPGNQQCSRIGSSQKVECSCPAKTKLSGQLCIDESLLTTTQSTTTTSTTIQPTTRTTTTSTPIRTTTTMTTFKTTTAIPTTTTFKTTTTPVTTTAIPRTTTTKTTTATPVTTMKTTTSPLTTIKATTAIPWTTIMTTTTNPLTTISKTTTAAVTTIKTTFAAVTTIKTTSAPVTTIKTTDNPLTTVKATTAIPWTTAILGTTVKTTGLQSTMQTTTIKINTEPITSTKTFLITTPTGYSAFTNSQNNNVNKGTTQMSSGGMTTGNSGQGSTNAGGQAGQGLASSSGQTGKGQINTGGQTGKELTNSSGQSGQGQTHSSGQTGQEQTNSGGLSGQGQTNSGGQTVQGVTNSSGKAGQGQNNSGGQTGQGQTNSSGQTGQGQTNSGGQTGQGVTNSSGQEGQGQTNSGGQTGQGQNNIGGQTGQGITNSIGQAGRGQTNSGGQTGQGQTKSGVQIGQGQTTVGGRTGQGQTNSDGLSGQGQTNSGGLSGQGQAYSGGQTGQGVTNSSGQAGQGQTNSGGLSGQGQAYSGGQTGQKVTISSGQTGQSQTISGGQTGQGQTNSGGQTGQNNSGSNSQQPNLHEASRDNCMKSKPVVLFTTFLSILVVGLATAAVILTYILIKTKNQLRAIDKTADTFGIE